MQNGRSPRFPIRLVLSLLVTGVTCVHAFAYDIADEPGDSSNGSVSLSSPADLSVEIAAPEIYVRIGDAFVVYDDRPGIDIAMGPAVLVSTRPAIVARRVATVEVHPRYRELDDKPVLMFDESGRPVHARTNGIYLIAHVFPHWGRLAEWDALRNARGFFNREHAAMIADEIWRAGEVYGLFLAGRLEGHERATTTWALREGTVPDWFYRSSVGADDIEALEAALIEQSVFDHAQQVYVDLAYPKRNVGLWTDDVRRSYSALTNASGNQFYFQRFVMGDRRKELFSKTLMWTQNKDNELELVSILSEFDPPARAPDFNGNGIPDFVITDFYYTKVILMDGHHYRSIAIPNFTNPLDGRSRPAS